MSRGDSGCRASWAGSAARPGEQKLEVDRAACATGSEASSGCWSPKGPAASSAAPASRARRPRDLARGYTNAGKSTLLNVLTKSAVFVEHRMFATLDPSSRRLRLPREREVVINDTVGFIRDLPKDLLAAFGATLEEISDSNLSFTWSTRLIRDTTRRSPRWTRS